MKKTLTLADVIGILRKKQGGRTNRDFAAELGISGQFLGDIYEGRRTPGEKVLTPLGLKSRMIYEFEMNGAKR